MGATRRSRRSRLIEALLLAAVALATLALAGPAVARPSTHSVVYPISLSSAEAVTAICLAAVVTVALVATAAVASGRRPRKKTTRIEPQGRASKAPRQQAAA